MNAFSEILRAMVERIPGATGAIFADWEGESVGEFAHELPQLEIQIVGAQWGMVWLELQRSLARARLGDARELIVEGDGGSFLVQKVTDQYYVVLAVARGAHLAKAMAELNAGATALRAEM